MTQEERLTDTEGGFSVEEEGEGGGGGVVRTRSIIRLYKPAS